MRKLVVAGLALVLTAGVAFAAVRIFVYDVCPLTGRPLHRAPAADALTTPPTSDQ